MGFMEAVKSCFRRYVDFQGRSPRSEYWWFVLFYLIVYIVLIALSAAVPILGILLLIFVLGIILPLLAVSIQRQPIRPVGAVGVAQGETSAHRIPPVKSVYMVCSWRFNGLRARSDLGGVVASGVV